MRHLRFANIKQRLRNVLVASVFIGAQAGFALAPFLPAATATAAEICINDQQGANDEPGQKDLTRFCEDTGANTIGWNWDELSVSGNGQSLDACALFDTDGDGFANRALCISTQDGDPYTKTVYTCNDTRADRCAGADTGNPASSTCNVAVTATQPFGAGSDTPNDLTANCSPTVADTASGDLIDVCSFPSGQPNSDPSDCVVARAKAGKLEVKKDLVPSIDTGLFNLQIDGVTAAPNVGDNGTTGEVVVSEGNHSVGELAGTNTSLASYTSSIECKDLNGTGSVVASGAVTSLASVPVADGADVLCIITNTKQQGSITLIKNVVNNNGGSATADQFGLTIGGNATTSGQSVSLSPGSYAINEAGLPGYSFVNITGTGCPAQLGGSVNLANGQDITCTITNDDVGATLTLVKTVTNNNGGTATSANFQGKIDGSDVAWSAAIPVNAGAHTATEVALAGGAGYTASSWTGDCAANGTVNLSLAQNATCYITNDDQAPGLILNKLVSNLHGGTATESAWTLTANGPTSISGPGAAGSSDVVSGSTFAAGTYTLSESGGPSGYSASAWTCTNGVVVTNSQITLSNGQTTVCSITNSDVAPIITIIKQVLNPYGTPLSPDAFMLTLGGNSVLSGVNNQVSAGSYVVGETTANTGYTFTSFTGENCTVENGVMTALGVIGGTTTCTVTNTAIQPKVVIIKHVINDNGGTKSADDFTMTVSDNTQAVDNFPGDENGTEIGLNEGPYTVDELADAGYTKSIGADCVGTISVGQVKTCTITNDDKPGSLTVNKVVENGLDGDFEADDFSFKIDGDDTDYSFVNGQTTTVGSKTVELDAGTYSATENDSFGYDKDDSDCKNVEVKNGEEASCTITNTAQRKFQICHRTASNENPYVKINVPVSSIDGIDGNQAGQDDHFGEHKGPIWFLGIEIEWGDIIPPLEGVHEGLNWDAYGQATYEDNCTPPAQVVVTKYNDLNRNDQYDQGEELLADWEFNLTGQELCEEPELEVFLFQAIDLDNQGCADYNYDETQSTDADGTTTFTGVRPGVTHELTETIPEDSNWHLGNITCSGDQAGQDGDTYFISNVPSGGSVNCFVGNYRDTALNLTKENNRPNPTTVGDTVTYTLTVTVPEDSGQVFGATVTDLTPEGFTYIPGSWNATLDGEPMLVEEPQYGSPGIWVLGNLLPGQVVKLTYRALIGANVSNGTYPDLAFARGCNIDCSNVNAAAVFANVSTGASTPFVGTNVSITRPAVLAANITRYVNTGASDVWMNTLAAITLAGAAFITLVRREQKGAK